MDGLAMERAFTLLEPGPAVLVATHDGRRANVMTITWTMVMDFSARFAITTGPWNHSWSAITGTRECVIAVPTVDLIDTLVGVGTCSGRDTDKFERFGPGSMVPAGSGGRSTPSATAPSWSTASGSTGAR